MKNSNYSYSHYFPNIKNGEYNEYGIKCVDLNNIPFNNETFDIFVTLDVFEHLFEPIVALKEIFRIIKRGGCFIMTVPIENKNNSTEKACFQNEKNEIIYIETKKSIEKNVKLEYHGNPVDNNGSVVTYYYGYDIIDIIKKNTEFSEVKIFFNSNEDLKNYGIF